MYLFKRDLAIIFSNIIFFSTCTGNQPTKIVSLIQVHNEEAIIEQCLKCLAVYTDAMVVLDDASADNTLAILKSLSERLHIEKIIENKECAWQTTSERDNRQALLDAGRSINGTHFILIDADEMFNANCLKDNWLRQQILKLKSGQCLKFPMVNVWNGINSYRDDEYCSPFHRKWNAIPAAFYDDGTCSYLSNNSSSPSGTIHVARDPLNRQHTFPDITITDVNYAMLHFKCADLKNIDIKKAWYMCFEYIQANKKLNNRQKNALIINKFYSKNVFNGLTSSTLKIKLTPIPTGWYAKYGALFDGCCFFKEYTMKLKDISDWFKDYGIDYFAPLDIWDIESIKNLTL